MPARAPRPDFVPWWLLDPPTLTVKSTPNRLLWHVRGVGHLRCTRTIPESSPRQFLLAVSWFSQPSAKGSTSRQSRHYPKAQGFMPHKHTESIHRGVVCLVCLIWNTSSGGFRLLNAMHFLLGGRVSSLLAASTSPFRVSCIL